MGVSFDLSLIESFRCTPFFLFGLGLGLSLGFFFNLTGFRIVHED